ncbi:unnamed protein product [Orchesella dallaii]|uniref:BTB domain-containing protein n=1 Tax=Orchesella dallaii TaxID=48710 RepID=A0ABP1R8P9_9HEXA
MSNVNKVDLWFAKKKNENSQLIVRSLWNSDDPFVDLVVKVLKCGNEEESEFRAHALILGMSSPVLALHLFGKSRLTTCQGGTEAVLVIKQLHPSVVKMMLEFIYTGSIVLLEETTLAMEKIGGLLFAAKLYNIPKLAELCHQTLEKDLTDEKALEKFDHLLNPKTSKIKKNHRKAYEYHKELMKYYLAYVLRNGERILRTDRFKRISIPSLKSICSSDFLCASELTVYRAILRWATEQCKIRKSRPTMENCRRILGIDDKSLGIMELVRFSQLDSAELITKIDRSQIHDRLLPEKLVQELYRISVLEEPTELYTSTPRTSYQDDTFKQYVEDFVDKLTSKTLVLDAGAGVRSSRSQRLSVEIKLEKGDNPVSVTKMVSQCNFDAFPKSTSSSQVSNSSNLQYDSKKSSPNASSIVSHSLVKEGQENPLNLKVVEVVTPSHKVQSNKLNCNPSSINFTGEEKKKRREKKTETLGNNVTLTSSDAIDQNCHIKDLPVLIRNSNSTYSSSASPRAVVDGPKIAKLDKPTEERLRPSSLISSPIAVPPHSASVNDGSTVTISDDLVNMEFKFPKPQAPECIDNNSPLLPQPTLSQPTYMTSPLPSVELKGKASTQLPVPTQSKKARKRKYKEERSTSQQTTKSRKILSQQDNHISETKPRHRDENERKFKESVISYQDIISDCSKDNTITKFILKDVGIREFKKKSCSFKSIYMPHLKNFSVDFNSCNTKTTPALIKELSDINLEHYIFFYVKNAVDTNRLAELWNQLVNVRLTFCGISVFEMCPNDGILTINYTKNSSFLLLNQLKTNDLKSLSLANCKILQKNWLEPNSCKHLSELILFKVSVLKCTEVIKECSNLQRLSIWPSIMGKLSLNDVNSSVLVSLAVHNLMIKCDINDRRPFERLEVVCFQDCTWDEKFIENFSMMFPKLRKITVCSSYSQPGPDLLRVLIKMESLQKLSLWNFDLKLLEKQEFQDVKLFLRKLGIQKSANQCHFKLKRGINNEWKGRNTTLEKQCIQAYEFFGFSKLYTLETWKKVCSLNCM